MTLLKKPFPLTPKNMTETLTAGRELDALVAEKVMGFHIIPEKSTVRVASMSYIKPSEARPYSSLIEAAWPVIEKLREDGWCIDIRIDDEPWDNEWIGGYGVSLLGCNRGRTDATDIFASADSLPEAICLAALKAVGL